MKTPNWIFASLLLLACSDIAPAQTDKAGSVVLVAQATMAAPQEPANNGNTTLDAHQEKRAMQIFLKIVENRVVSAADAMPANKYVFAPTEGQFKGVRTFAQQVKHLAATNYILAAAALGRQHSLPSLGLLWSQPRNFPTGMLSASPGIRSGLRLWPN
jgi:hypothetical protein